MSSHYIVEEEFPIYFLDCSNSFQNLTEAEKKYSFALIKAGWYGALIDYVQCSPESPALFLLSQKLFKRQNPEKFENRLKELKVNELDIKHFFNYFATVYGNLGNYRSFGDSKFIPRIDEENFDRIIKLSDAYTQDVTFREIYDTIKPLIFSLTSRNKQMGLGEEGISTYYSLNCTMDDANKVQVYLDENNISAYNTRVFKRIENGITKYEVRQASSLQNVNRRLEISNPSHNTEVNLINGDYREVMSLMVDELRKAKDLALNETERSMIKCYIESFETGSIDAHKEGSKYWIQDKGPTVENYIGFIESYRDPFGVRGEFETFVAVVNKEMSRKFESLVDKAPSILNELPWPKEYEKDRFLQPDFTSLDIINFPVSGMPVGINIPNYDDIRQDLGFKNVSLGNVLKSRFKDPKSNFIPNEHKEIFIQNAENAFEVQVGLHELIGHGSGKLFQFKDGQYNFDFNQTKDLITNGSIERWYKVNETWDSVFTTIASPFEECRAECVGLYLCTLPEIGDIFGFSDQAKLNDIVFVNWLSMIKSSLMSMEFYTPEQKRWRQAHCHARYVILQVLLEAGQDLLTIETITAEDGRPDLFIHLDRSKIITVGRPAIGEFLKRLQYYKSTANVKDGVAFFHRYSFLNEQFLHYREIVLDRKLPRGIIIQCVVCGEDNHPPRLVEYPTTSAGMIQSFVDRFSGDQAESALYDVWKRDRSIFL